MNCIYLYSRRQAEDSDQQEGLLGGEGPVSGCGELADAVPRSALEPKERRAVQGRNARRGALRGWLAVHTQRQSTGATSCASEYCKVLLSGLDCQKIQTTVVLEVRPLRYPRGPR